MEYFDFIYIVSRALLWKTHSVLGTLVFSTLALEMMFV